MRCAHLPAAIAIALLSAAPLAAESRPVQPVLKDAHAVLRVSDGRWVDRQVAQLAAACGQDPALLRGRVARSLYACASSDGIDLQRPALLAWREGRSPLLAIIPVANRRAFLDSFGVLPEGQPPLVRISDRDGTVVFTQNHPGRRDEYRLLISGDTAYLARNAEECRQLAERPLVHAGQAGAVEFTAWPPFHDGLKAGVDLPFAPPSLIAPATGADLVADLGLRQMTAALARDATEWTWRLEGDDRSATWKATVALPAGTAAGDWLRAQSNGTVRAAGALPPGGTLMRAWFQASWQGQCEVAGLELMPQAKAKAGERWTAALEEAWKTTFAMLDRTGGMAGAMDVGAPARPTAIVIEHPQAQLLAQQLVAIDAGFKGVEHQGDPALPGWQLGATEAVRTKDPGISGAVAHADRTIVIAGTADASAPALAKSVLERAAAGPAAPEAPPGIAGLRLDVSRYIAVTFAERLDEGVELAPAVLAVDVRVEPEHLTIQGRVPTAELVQALSRVAWK